MGQDQRLRNEIENRLNNLRQQFRALHVAYDNTPELAPRAVIQREIWDCESRIGVLEEVLKAVGM